VQHPVGLKSEKICLGHALRMKEWAFAKRYVGNVEGLQLRRRRCGLVRGAGCERAAPGDRQRPGDQRAGSGIREEMPARIAAAASVDRQDSLSIMAGRAAARTLAKLGGVLQLWAQHDPSLFHDANETVIALPL
jgi:hypothetical protein